MDLHELLIDAFYFLIATLTFVPLFRWLKLGSILGYIVAGILIGPTCLAFIDNSKSIFELAELGIILLLFMVGLELSPARLKALRKGIVIEGGLQMLLTTLTISLIGLALELQLIPALIIGVALSLSSTAFALTYLTNNSQLTLTHGQSALSILLLQDLLIVPILALIPLFGVDANFSETLDVSAILFKFLLFCSTLTICFFVLGPAISFIRKTQDQEISLAALLFLIIGMAIGMEMMGLSKAMGSFIAGVFLANSEIKNDVKSTTIPFKGILMGVFFMALGMEFDFKFFNQNLGKVTILCFGLLVSKAVILFAIGKLRSGYYKNGIRLGLLLSPGGEFGIVVLGSALQFKIISGELSKLMISSIIVTMIVAPFLARISEFLNTSPRVQEDDHENVTELKTADSVNIPTPTDNKAA